jgi:replication factor A1
MDKEFITTDIAKDKMKQINIVAKIESIGEPRDINLKSGGQTKVYKCVLSDTKGTIDLQLWGDDIKLVGVRDIVKISNGYMNDFRGEKSLNVGKFGKLEVVEKASA